MPMPRSSAQFRPSPTFALIFVLLCVLWLAGGASRADALGQVVVRGCAWALLVGLILIGRRPLFRDVMPVLIITLTALALALVALVPLPPAIWTGLPGREQLIEASAASGQPQPWRPWSIVPGATANAAFSMVVPLTTLVLVADLRDEERSALPSVLLGFVTASALLGLIQFSGVTYGNPLINDTIGQVSGSFANRNHFALFLAFGCLLTPTWAFAKGHRPGWRAPVAAGLALLFALTILATGSRAGLILGATALVAGVALVGRALRKSLNQAPRWVLRAFVPAVVCAILGAVWVSIAADRAISIDRAFAIDPGQDMRGRALPTVLVMIWSYWPTGAGPGSFDAMFRLHEPFSLLKLTYFNHAHNDLLEVVLDAGLAGLLLLLAALGWWFWASVRAWRGVAERDGRGQDVALARLGSAMLFLVIIASTFDYPARTPMITAIMVVAGAWLSAGTVRRNAPALPGRHQHL